MSLRLRVFFLFLGAAIMSITSGYSLEKADAQEYLGQYTFFRGWKGKRRLLVVAGSDREVETVRRQAVYGYRCEMALRNINLVLLGNQSSKEISFFHDEKANRNFISTTPLSTELSDSVKRHLRSLYGDLPFGFWGILIGYDGGRKDLYRREPNFASMIDRIDRMPMRRREAQLQAEKGMICRNSL